MQIAIKLDAGNDRNGNPRRGWLVYDAQLQAFDQEVELTSEVPIEASCALGWVEEGYEGRQALPRAYPDAHELCQLSVPYSEIRQARKLNTGDRS